MNSWFDEPLMVDAEQEAELSRSKSLRKKQARNYQEIEQGVGSEQEYGHDIV